MERGRIDKEKENGEEYWWNWKREMRGMKSKEGKRVRRGETHTVPPAIVPIRHDIVVLGRVFFLRYTAQYHVKTPPKKSNG